MATSILQRASWQLQVSRTSRDFAVSFKTAKSHRPKSHRISYYLNEPMYHDFSSSRRLRQQDTRRAFSSSRVDHAQQVQQAVISKPTPSSTAASPPRPTPTYTSRAASPTPQTSSATNIQDLSSGLSDQPVVLDEGSRQVDWAHSFHGLSTIAFPKEAADVLLQPIPAEDIEVKPDGIIYLPEIKYRRILNKAFGPGGWGLAPRSETIVTSKAVTREYALVVLGRLVSIARGEQDYFSPEGIPTAVEGCKSNALMRCCKDLGVASELWDPRFIRKFMTQHAKEVFVEHVVTKKRKKIFLRKEDQVAYPFKETKGFAS
ncbi:MAG: hypothetical protein MMC33_001978 [Icmadophila ericetorum]|nr:hypothetical protein [Icmadophila ericetorum]